MTARSRRASDAGEKSATADPPAIAACETSPGRLVFLESGNTDAWIATDHAVDLRR